ncbi:MAG TPA: hypothetical protein VJG90_00130 [Candidatus Nanoarchaeia archaeon]|nr:hypothetical protein [Candidatus Nanoarchaeia archaeon]
MKEFIKANWKLILGGISFFALVWLIFYSPIDVSFDTQDSYWFEVRINPDDNLSAHSVSLHDFQFSYEPDKKIGKITSRIFNTEYLDSLDFTVPKNLTLIGVDWSERILDKDYNKILDSYNPQLKQRNKNKQGDSYLTLTYKGDLIPYAEVHFTAQPNDKIFAPGAHENGAFFKFGVKDYGPSCGVKPCVLNKFKNQAEVDSFFLNNFAAVSTQRVGAGSWPPLSDHHFNLTYQKKYRKYHDIFHNIAIAAAIGLFIFLCKQIYNKILARKSSRTPSPPYRAG